MREYLQAQILRSLQRAGAFVPLAFQGGTALRFLFAIRRYSEYLDFALERRDRGYDFRVFLKVIEGDLLREGYAVGVKANDRKVVHSAFISFPGLLFEMGLSPHRNESLSIKVEVDTNPPARLNNALRQSGWEGEEVNEESTWRDLVRRRVETFD